MRRCNENVLAGPCGPDVIDIPLDNLLFKVDEPKLMTANVNNNNDST